LISRKNGEKIDYNFYVLDSRGNLTEERSYGDELIKKLSYHFNIFNDFKNN